MELYRFVAETGPVNVNEVARRLNNCDAIHAQAGTERVYGTIIAEDQIEAVALIHRVVDFKLEVTEMRPVGLPE